MDIPIPMVIGAVALILLLLIMIVSRGGSGRRDLIAPPVPVELSLEVEREARDLVLRGEKLAAIKLVRKSSGMGLKESKEAVERMDARP